MKTEKEIEKEQERYLEVQLEAVKWESETDTMQFSTVELLTLFALHIENQKLTEQKTERIICVKCEGTGRDGHDRCFPPNWYVCQGCGGTGY